MFVMTAYVIERNLDIHVNNADATDVVRRILTESQRPRKRQPCWWRRLLRV